MQSVIRGVQKTELKEGQKVCIGPGETEPGRLEWVGLRADPGGMYIRVVREEIPHFPIVFLSLLFLTNKSSLLSPLWLFFSDEKPKVPATVRGGGAAAGRRRRRRRRC